jgi:hypothetical protein
MNVQFESHWTYCDGVNVIIVTPFCLVFFLLITWFYYLFLTCFSYLIFNLFVTFYYFQMFLTWFPLFVWWSSYSPCISSLFLALQVFKSWNYQAIALELQFKINLEFFFLYIFFNFMIFLIFFAFHFFSFMFFFFFFTWKTFQFFLFSKSFYFILFLNNISLFSLFDQKLVWFYSIFIFIFIK